MIYSQLFFFFFSFLYFWLLIPYQVKPIRSRDSFWPREKEFFLLRFGVLYHKGEREETGDHLNSKSGSESNSIRQKKRHTYLFWPRATQNSWWLWSIVLVHGSSTVLLMDVVTLACCIPSMGKLRQTELTFNVSLGYTEWGSQNKYVGFVLLLTYEWQMI